MELRFGADDQQYNIHPNVASPLSPPSPQVLKWGSLTLIASYNLYIDAKALHWAGEVRTHTQYHRQTDSGRSNQSISFPSQCKQTCKESLGRDVAGDWRLGGLPGPDGGNQPQKKVLEGLARLRRKMWQRVSEWLGVQMLRGASRADRWVRQAGGQNELRRRSDDVTLHISIWSFFKI